MPRRLARKLHHKKTDRSTLVVYATILLLMFHYIMVAYINSSYLEQFVSSEAVGTIYTIGSALTVLIFLFVSRVLHKVGNYRATLGFLFINFLAVGGMAFADSLRTAIPLFIVHLTVLPLIVFNLDVFLEEVIGAKESSTGSKRGLILALSSLTAATTPLLTGYLIGDTTDFTLAYYVSALSVIPIMAIVFFSFKDFSEPKYKEIKVLRAIRSFWVKKDIRFVFGDAFLLQLFFFFMVVYAPLYLATVIELSWTDIGLILFGGQLAYVFFEYPIGRIGDQYLGEKEMMAVGFLILAVSSAMMAFVDSSGIWPWILVMFFSRTGASLAEVTTESYFFKHTKSSDAQVISFFRITRPLAYVVGALTGSLVLLYLPFNLIFVVLGLLMLPGVVFATYLKDTK